MHLLNAAQLTQVETLRQQSTPEQLIWLSGYFYGLASQNATPALSANSPATSLPSVTILVATQTGNAQQVADQLKQALQARGIEATLTNASDCKVKALSKLSHLVIVSSTYGEGEPPDTAAAFYKGLLSDKAPQLPELNYAVFGLGDSSYEKFCQTAIDFDERLNSLGATRLIDRVEADVEYQTAAKNWIETLTETLAGQTTTNTANNTLSTTANNQAWSESNPFEAEVIAITPITDVKSAKDVWHLELDIEGANIQYQAGDILAILANNQPELVDALLHQTGLNADDSVVINDQTYSLKTALLSKRQLRGITLKQLEAFAALVDQPSLIANTPLDKNTLAQSDVLDVFNLASPIEKFSAQSLVDWLLPLRARQYSIASSQNLVDDEVHLCVRQVVYELNGRTRYGVCSNLIAQLKEGDKVKIYVKSNPNFKLPAHTDTPVIMVGPGTGIAPFRAFMQQREAQGCVGKSWLFFGEQHAQTDFLYQIEWQKWVKSGVLEKISLAFSRDQAEKIYVQHRMLEAGAELYQWLENGAHFYVCGDQATMAKDVHAALLQVIQQHGQKTETEAEAYLETLVQQKRYQRDVY